MQNAHTAEPYATPVAALLPRRILANPEDAVKVLWESVAGLDEVLVKP